MYTPASLPANKTKLVCTIGPATDSPDMLEKMLLAGMNIARLNFSHGDFRAHGEIIRRIREAARATQRPVAIMADLPGPKIRIGTLAEEPVELRVGSRFTLTSRQLVGNRELVSVSLPELPRVVRPDDIPLSAHIRLTIGGAELRLRNPAAAEAIAREVLTGEPYTEQNVGLSTLATARRLLGDSLRNQGRPAEAIPHLERAVAEQEQARGPDDQSTIAALSSLGYLYSLTGDEERRAELQREVYARSVRRWGADNQYTLIELINLGDAERDGGNAERAREHLAAAVAGLERVAGPDSTVLHAARFSYAGALADTRRYEEALAVAGKVDPAKLAASSSDASGHGKLAELRGQILLGLRLEAEGQAELARAGALLAESS